MRPICLREEQARVMSQGPLVTDWKQLERAMPFICGRELINRLLLLPLPCLDSSKYLKVGPPDDLRMPVTCDLG